MAYAPPIATVTASSLATGGGSVAVFTSVNGSADSGTAFPSLAGYAFVPFGMLALTGRDFLGDTTLASVTTSADACCSSLSSANLTQSEAVSSALDIIADWPAASYTAVSSQLAVGSALMSSAAVTRHYASFALLNDLTLSSGNFFLTLSSPWQSLTDTAGSLTLANSAYIFPRTGTYMISWRINFLTTGGGLNSVEFRARYGSTVDGGATIDVQELSQNFNSEFRPRPFYESATWVFEAEAGKCVKFFAGCRVSVVIGGLDAARGYTNRVDISEISSTVFAG